MADRKGSAALTARKTRVGVKPSAVRVPAGASAASSNKPSTTGVAGNAGATLPLRPPLEAALDAFARELRGALERSTAELAALRTELAALRQRYEKHSHDYQWPALGSNGTQWIELRFLQSYLDGKHPGYNKWGVFAHGSSASGVSSKTTTGPSA